MNGTSQNSPRTGKGARAEVQADGPDTSKDSAAHAAEAAILGCMILSSAARTGAVDLLDPDDFDREAHRTLFDVLDKMHTAEEHVDPVTTNDRLATSGLLDEVGGGAAVWHLVDPLACPSPAAWKVYAEIVAREGRRRRGIRVLRRAIERLEAGEDPATVAAEMAVAV